MAIGQRDLIELDCHTYMYAYIHFTVKLFNFIQQVTTDNCCIESVLPNGPNAGFVLLCSRCSRHHQVQEDEHHTGELGHRTRSAKPCPGFQCPADVVVNLAHGASPCVLAARFQEPDDA